ncbi:MAG: TDT family transporter [Spirochaetia bacterium]
MKLITMPIGFVATTLGTVTLGNIYGLLGYTWLRHILNSFGIAIALLMLAKLVIHHTQCREEYKNPVLASLYPVFCMLMMLVSAFLFYYQPQFAKSLWFASIGLHALFILLFTYKHLIRGFKYETFIPTWFVTYFGILVAGVVGKPFNEPTLIQCLVYYGLSALLILYCPILIRVFRHGIPHAFCHSRGIFLAPPSLILLSSLNAFPSVNSFLIIALYSIIMGAFLHTCIYIPSHFSRFFTPVFAGITFPMAIATLAAIKTSEFFADKYPQFSSIVFQVSGVQLFLTTAFICVVLFQFFKTFSSQKGLSK